MRIISRTFEEGEVIPERYTCEGEDIIPSLRFEDVPDETKSLALIIEDPDAPGKTWIHWILFDIPPNMKKVAETYVPRGKLGKNDFGNLDYGGPCPASGTHKYLFGLYALNEMLNLNEGVTIKEIKEAIKNKIIDKAVLTATYSKKKLL